MSFYVKLKARDDSEATHWGVDLERAKEASRAQIGDQVQLARRNSNSDNSNRVTWSVRVLGRSRAKRALCLGKSLCQVLNGQTCGT